MTDARVWIGGAPGRGGVGAVPSSVPGSVADAVAGDAAGRHQWAARAIDGLNGLEPGPDLVDAALQFALDLGDEHPFPGGSSTTELWELLATVAAADLSAARALEPHLDALAILAQAGRLDLAAPRPPASAAPPSATAAADESAQRAAAPADDGGAHRGGRPPTWGVFAAEGGPDPLIATGPTADAEGRGSTEWTLNGTKLWCSLADRLDAALVSATSSPADGGGRRLFAVDLRQPGVQVEPGTWHARGLSDVPSGPVRFEDVAALPIGDAGWYLDRPGFSWGGIGVAACWFGGAVGLARTLFARAQPAPGIRPPVSAPTTADTTATTGIATIATPSPIASASPIAIASASSDPLLHMHLGVVDERLEDARRALAEAAALVDGGHATGDAGRLLAMRVRATVARACEDVLAHVAHALGPAPLALDAEHAKRAADLELYVRQHHAEKDSAALGRHLAGSATAPW